MAVKRKTRRAYKPNSKLGIVANQMLEKAGEIFAMSSELDTTIRDTVADGLAYLVYSAFDTRAIAENIVEFNVAEYIQHCTYQWFRDRGFVEWFCVGASTLFRTTPRHFFQRTIVKRITNPKRK
jgi:hypothetical protein